MPYSLNKSENKSELFKEVKTIVHLHDYTHKNISIERSINMRYIASCVLLIIATITFTSCGDTEQPLQPSTPITDITISDNYFENSELFYKPTREQVEELLNLKYPSDWYNEEDLELQSKYYYAMLLQRYGNRPEVHINAQYNAIHILSMGKPIKVSPGDIILVLKSRYLIWPDSSNLSALKSYQTTLEEDIILQTTEDPDVYVKIATERYIKQYGDIPEVHTVVEGDKKLKFGGFRVSTEAEKDNYINYLRAKYVLQPTERFLCILNAHIDAKENQTPFHLIEHDCPETTMDEILDIINDDAE